ncbi:penicillin-binding protein activator [Tropicimonas sp. IMCC34011]|uniref:penicillin-binding protein activator n=1 Tax=Tropicimonas sp. IMCC34011 TaxID=2248759 RepID=UPI000E22C77E|nr:penicillin-binding protein activator [Tropicimonas sp. IMCC34011]
MTAVLDIPRTAIARLAALASIVLLASCGPLPITSGGSGPSIDASAPVPVALMIPTGSGNPQDAQVAQSLERAARLAMADLDGVEIDLRTYSTGGSDARAAQAANTAVAEGAKILLGPLYSGASNAAAVAVADEGVNVLSFSNNAEIAGGNLFLLGNTFDNTANRLVDYAARNGRRNIYVVAGDSPGEEVGRQAIVNAIGSSRANLAGQSRFTVSQQGVASAAPQIASQARAAGADAVFFTSDNAGAMPLLAQLLPENGLGASTAQYIGLARFDIPSSALSQPGLQGSWFALPDPNLNTAFQQRYRAAYGSDPHPLAGLAYDGIAAIGALVEQRGSNALTRSALTQGSGFTGTGGIFRLRNDGTNQRALAVAQIRNNRVVVVDPAPRGFGGAGF